MINQMISAIGPSNDTSSNGSSGFLGSNSDNDTKEVVGSEDVEKRKLANTQSVVQEAEEQAATPTNAEQKDTVVLTIGLIAVSVFILALIWSMIQNCRRKTHKSAKKRLGIEKQTTAASAISSLIRSTTSQDTRDSSSANDEVGVTIGGGEPEGGVNVKKRAYKPAKGANPNKTD